MAGGFTMTLPKEDKYYGTKTEMQEEIVHLLGGRAAEKVTLDDISTGASNDIMRATDIARNMVTKYGFSDKLGLVNYSAADEVFLGKDFTTHKNYSEEIASEIDEEIKAIIDDSFATAVRILTENKDKLTVIAEALLEIETLDGEQFEELYSGALTLEQLREQIRDEEKDIRAKNEAEAAETELILKEAELADAEDEDYYDGDGYDGTVDGPSGDTEAKDPGPIGPDDEIAADDNGWVVERPAPVKKPAGKTVKKTPKRLDKEDDE
jgi:cell division protease FtsH